MKLNFGYLNTFFFAKPISHKQLNALPLLGFEYSYISNFDSEKFNYFRIVLIESIEPHPNASNLKICHITDSFNTMKVVCGATNVYEGMKTVYIPAGKKLPNGSLIDIKDIRGVTSTGMLCSAQELDLGYKTNGVLDLPSKSPIGAGFYSFFKDYLSQIDIEVYPNRSDTLSYVGMVNEFEQVPGVKVKITSSSLNKLNEESKTSLPSFLNKSKKPLARILDKRIGDGFLFICFKLKSKVLPQLPFLQTQALVQSGINQVSPLIDISNLVMIETGQPIHLYDTANLRGQLQIRFAKEGEKFEALDSNERLLSNSDIVISDNEKTLALGGLIGGVQSAINSSTQSFIVEIGCYNQEIVSLSSIKHSIRTEASSRFSKGLPFQLHIYALNRLIELFDYCKIPYDRSDVSFTKIISKRSKNNCTIKFNQAKINKLLGTNFSNSQIKKSLNKSQIKINRVLKNNSFICKLPFKRVDLSNESDIAEEVIRQVGYHSIKPSKHDNFKPSYLQSSSSIEYKKMMRLKQQLISFGYQETIHYSFISSLYKSNSSVSIKNPLSSEMAILRPNLLYSLISADTFNRSNFRKPKKIFEMGKSYSLVGDQFSETKTLAGLIPVDYQQQHWARQIQSDENCFFRIKSELVELSSQVLYQSHTLPSPWDQYLHPGRSSCFATTPTGIPFIVFGKLHPQLILSINCYSNLYYFNIDIDQLLATSNQHLNIKYTKFPSVQRDLSIIVNKSHPYSSVKNAIMSLNLSELTSVTLIDIYKLNNNESDEISYTIRIVLTPEIKTFTTEEIDILMSKIVKSIQYQTEAVLRNADYNKI
ncbi:MAG: phenylalanine--tRNA ligase subunit beta [Methylacidiphilales bacterium]|nr:phenylalanine--tRNA ligase subunit beta [Candidatus Methylacidiphilales bacterium]